MITCRICGLAAKPNEEAVLLCGECRRNPEAMQRHIDQVLDISTDRAASLLEALSLDDTRRYQAILTQRRAAVQAGGMALAAFHRRYQKTLAIPDALGKYLEAQEAADRTRAWHTQAVQELDALTEVLA